MRAAVLGRRRPGPHRELGSSHPPASRGSHIMAILPSATAARTGEMRDGGDSNRGGPTVPTRGPSSCSVPFLAARRDPIRGVMQVANFQQTRVSSCVRSPRSERTPVVKFVTALLVTGSMALAAAPAIALPPQANEKAAQGQGHQPATPGPSASAESKRKAYGDFCRDQSRKKAEGQTKSDFAKCVTAMAKAANDDSVTAREACKSLSKKTPPPDARSRVGGTLRRPAEASASRRVVRQQEYARSCVGRPSRQARVGDRRADRVQRR